MPFFNRHPRLPGGYYLGQRAYFVTICCAQRRPIFANIATGQWTLAKLIDVAAQRGFSLHAYCCMPDHLHVLALGLHEHSDAVKFIDGFKQRTGYEYRRREERQLWQARFYEHILRSADAIGEVACYIWMNPVRKGLCAEASVYPLSGSQTMEWMNFRPGNAGWVPPWKEKRPTIRRPG